MLRRILTGVVLTLVLVGGAIAGPFEDGVAAYRRGDYAAALRLWRPLAEQGDARAQITVGTMYSKGLGVPQDHVQAHMWLDLAASRFAASEAKDRDGAVHDRDLLASKMTPEQLAEAQRLAHEWKPSGATDSLNAQDALVRSETDFFVQTSGGTPAICGFEFLRD